MSDFCDIQLDQHSRPGVSSAGNSEQKRHQPVRGIRRIWSNFASRLRLRMDGGLHCSLRERSRLWNERGISLGLWSGGPGVDADVLPDGVVIGRYCSLGPLLALASQNHPIDRVTTSSMFYEPNHGQVPSSTIPENPTVLIGHDVWIGANVSITPGCNTIGHGAIIGAGSVVTRPVPSLAIVAGNPAKLVRWRLEGDRAEDWLLSRWWRFPPDALKSLPGFTSTLAEDVRMMASVSALPGARDSEALRRFDGMVDSKLAKIP